LCIIFCASDEDFTGSKDCDTDSAAFSFTGAGFFLSGEFAFFLRTDADAVFVGLIGVPHVIDFDALVGSWVITAKKIVFAALSDKDIIKFVVIN